MHTVGIVCYDGVDEVELLAPLDILSSIRTIENGHWSNEPAFDIKLVADRVSKVETSHGVTVIPMVSFQQAGTFEIVVVPGGPGARLIKYPESVIPWLVKQAATCKTIVSCSTGSFILARAGLLQNRRVAVYPAFAADLRRIEPTATVVTCERVVLDNNNLISTSGISNSVDAALVLVERCEGIRSAEIAAKRVSWPMHINDIAPLYST